MNRDQDVAALKQEWKQNPRWKDVRRGYVAEDVVRLRGSVQVEYTLARRGAQMSQALLNEVLD